MINEAVGFCDSRGDKLFQLKFLEENLVENVNMFSRTLGGNSNYNLEKVYFWLPFERIVDENGEFFYVSLVENGLRSTADLSEHYGTLINDFKKKRVANNENCLVLRVTASSISIAPANCASTVPFTACSTTDCQVRNQDVLGSDLLDSKNSESSACEEGWLEDGKNNCLKVLAYEDGISDECESQGASMDVLFQLSYWFPDITVTHIYNQPNETCTNIKKYEDINMWEISSDASLCGETVNYVCEKPSLVVEQEIVPDASIPGMITAQMTGNYHKENILSCEENWSPTGTGECLRFFTEGRDFESAISFCGKQGGKLAGYPEYMNNQLLKSLEQIGAAYIDIDSDSSSQMTSTIGRIIDQQLIEETIARNLCGVLTTTENSTIIAVDLGNRAQNTRFENMITERRGRWIFLVLMMMLLTLAEAHGSVPKLTTAWKVVLYSICGLVALAATVGIIIVSLIVFQSVTKSSIFYIPDSFEPVHSKI
ncbi:Oidioi.mRNA.OKI2018_I69.chr2.g5136.t1.cds [Oikopleura dioica]|uniref:Oidioi.mRNA.OKI2018_I69.chr2.g5136.t1.cds n=1 Tax=Oikopleura dioica TaxID=34765 RepID=A0ABN7T650_OIKDI|nr:Oidioi.mRNA.OKI2018_I69.chr2.g5136.t1.cds [Oikopleura dioica]